MQMPLLEMSPNIQESEASSRKRSHDEFAGDGKHEEKPPATPRMEASKGDPMCLDADPLSTASSPLSEAGTITPPGGSPSPESPKKMGTPKAAKVTSTATSTTPKPKPTPSSSNPPAKRKRLTAAEKEEKEKEQAAKKKEREEKLAVKAAEKAKAEEEKAARAKEREEKRRKKEEEQQRIQDEKDRKARSQRTLNSFFAGTPKKNTDKPPKTQTPVKDSPVKPITKPKKSQYEKMFHPFFVKENTRLASLGPQMDEETREAKARILDEFISGKRGENVATRPFNAVDLFAFPSKPAKRGKLHHPVRHIMEKVYQDTEKSKNPDEARKIIAKARQKLAKIPVKVISFSQDVRPPYYGTMTFKQFALGQNNMSQVARNPIGKRLPLDYNYDSEAEWQEEEGEDIDVDDDEEELDDEDDMEGFLDDSEDAGLSRRIFANTLEPESTGICFENHRRQGPNEVTFEHKMEFIHEGLEQTWGIDPFSTQYWEPEPKPKTSKAAPAAVEASKKMAPPPAPANAFAALTAAANPSDAPKLVKSELLNDFKKAILDNNALSKVGIVDFIFHQFRDNVSRIEVKNTLELVAEKKGVGRQKAWALKPGHEIVS